MTHAGLRLIDGGTVSALRSQTTWHAIAAAMAPADSPVFSIQRPAAPYVSIGFHTPLEAVDEGACRTRGLPVYRRRAGGGPVLCGPDQLFFQLIVPVKAVPARRDHAWACCLGPAADAFRALGADARLGDGNDIRDGGVKLSGTGAAQIGDAVVFVGNVIFDFDHHAMAEVLSLPGAAARGEVERLMRHILVPLPRHLGRGVGPAEAARALIHEYERSFGPAVSSELNAVERQVLEDTDRLFTQRRWIAADRAPRRPGVKIRSGAGVVIVGDVAISVVDGRIERALLPDGWVPAPGMQAALARALEGLPLDLATIAEAVARVGGDRSRGKELGTAIVEACRGWS